MQKYSSIYNSKIGNLKIEAEDDILIGIHFVNSWENEEFPNEATEKAKKQLAEYFNGQRKQFNLKYKFQGTEFEKAVWKELEKIPYGKTVTYKDISIRIGNVKAVRAVANAIGKNNFCIVVPCHRVIGSTGKLTRIFC